MITIGEDHHEVTGRKKNQKGYILVLIKTHPNADTNGYVLEHRVVMEIHLGRYLKNFRLETVHHKDGNKQNNDISNLELLTASEHTILTHTGLKRSEETKKKLSEKALERLSEKVNHPSYKNVDRELIKLLKEGKTKAEVARILGVTRKTIYNKLEYLEETP